MKTHTLKACGTCKYFRMHYVRHARGRYCALGYGHCTHPRLKRRKAQDQACVHFHPADECR